MKKWLTSAALVAGILTSSHCFAALEYNYNRDTKMFVVKSEEIIPLENGSNTLIVAFTKEYNLLGKRGFLAKKAEATTHLRMMVSGKERYEFATNANYWQEHNYTYEEMETLKAREAVKKAIGKNEKGEDELENRTLKRNPSTLIYLHVENDISDAEAVNKLYEFENPIVVKNREKQAKKEKQKHVAYKPKVETEYSVPDAALDENRRDIGISSKNENLMELELAAAEARQRALEEEKDKELLAKLVSENSAEAEALRNKILAREAEKKIAEVNAREEKINSESLERAAVVEEVKAARKAFEQYLAEQKAAVENKAYVSKADAKLSDKDNFWKKVSDSDKKQVPLFLEVKFWKGGANQRLWLKEDKLKELNQLLAYDLYKDEANLKLIYR